MSKRGRDPEQFDLNELAETSTGFSGAEIEESIVSSLFDVFYDKKDLSTNALLESLRATVPLSKTMSEDMNRLRSWAEGRARQATSPEAAVEASSGKRKLEI